MKGIKLKIISVAILICAALYPSFSYADDALDKAILNLDVKTLTAEAEKAQKGGDSALAGKLYFKVAEYYELKSRGKKTSEWKESEKFIEKALEALKKAAVSENATPDIHFELVRALVYRIRHFGGLFDLYKIITNGQAATKEIETLKKIESAKMFAETALGIQTLYKPENMEGGIEKAVPHFEKAKSAAPDNPEVLYWFARAYSLQGAKGEDRAKAVEYLKKAIEMNPEDSRYRMEIEKISSK